MKKLSVMMAALLIAPSVSLANEVTTMFQADPIVVTADIDNWETDSALQLPDQAPTTLVSKRIDMTKSYDDYTTAMAKLRGLLAQIGFEATKDELIALDAARLDVTTKLTTLRKFEIDFVQEKMLFQSDPATYAEQIQPTNTKIAKN